MKNPALGIRAGSARRHDSFRRKNNDAWDLVKTYGLDACAVFDVLTLSTVARVLTVDRL